MPVKLQPGKVYWVGINSPSHKNFKTPDRVPANWYVILFATAGPDRPPRLYTNYTPAADGGDVVDIVRELVKTVPEPSEEDYAAKAQIAT